MLVLTRKVGETVIIGTDIEVTVLEIVNAKIRLGFVAPRDVPIQRSELRLQPPAEPTASPSAD